MFNCDQSTILKIILFVKNAITLIKIAVPVLLIILSMIDILKLVIGNISDDKISGTTRKIVNRFLAAIVVFLVPTFLNIFMGMIDVETIESTSCWKNANEEYIAQKQEEEARIEKEKSDAIERARQETASQRQASAIAARKALQFKDNTSLDGGGVLIIAGHAPSPECNACSDCRGYASSGYAEELETRALALSLKKALLDKGVNAVIANQALVGDEDDEIMNASFLCSRTGKGSYADAFKALDDSNFWNSFSYVIEIHFDAGGGYGSSLVTNGGETDRVTETDQAILNAVANYTGKNRGIIGYRLGTLGNWNYFKHGKNKPITYLETEFYDNQSAMQNYKTNQEKIAEDIAEILKSAS